MWGPCGGPARHTGRNGQGRAPRPSYGALRGYAGRAPWNIRGPHTDRVGTRVGTAVRFRRVVDRRPSIVDRGPCGDRPGVLTPFDPGGRYRVLVASKNVVRFTRARSITESVFSEKGAGWSREN